MTRLEWWSWLARGLELFGFWTQTEARRLVAQRAWYEQDYRTEDGRYYG